jgi:NAD(P)-dependent dehydrogenase (short-subunit alcohol dehydrogenase family)
MSLEQVLADIRQTNVTKTVHRKSYPTISPTHPKLSQAGRSILITGGGTGAGFAMAKAFIRASAATLIIIGRRADVLENARASLTEESKITRTGTKIITQTCDVTNLAQVDALWADLAAKNIVVNVYIANAAKFTEPQPMLSLGMPEVWNQVETNVKSPLYFAEKFHSQSNSDPDKQKVSSSYIPPLIAVFIVKGDIANTHRQVHLKHHHLNITTASISGQAHPEVAARPAYTLSKLSSTLLFQLLASDIPHSKTQILSFHPGLIFNAYWGSIGGKPEWFDDEELTGNFAVWAASKEAAFLHGRFVWCSWDVEEMRGGEVRKRMQEDPYYLRASIVGLAAGMKT